jgi:hypothetical protein
MEYQAVPIQLDLNDPEEGFTFSSSKGGLALSLVDWRAKRVQLSFHGVFKFCFAITDRFRALPEASFVEVVDSPDIRELIANHVATAGDGLRHFVISTNEDEWCEVIAGGYDFKINA